MKNKKVKTLMLFFLPEIPNLLAFAVTFGLFKRPIADTSTFDFFHEEILSDSDYAAYFILNNVRQGIAKKNVPGRSMQGTYCH